jgi:hypothetical protein
VKVCVTPPVARIAVIGDTVTVIDVPATIVMVALADFVGSATAVAVTVTVGGLGTAAGPVYVIGAPDALTAADRLPHDGPPHSEPESAQLTPLFAESPVTVATNAVVPLTGTDAIV